MTFDPDSIHSWLERLPFCGSHVVVGVNEDDCAVLQTESGLLLLTADFLNKSPIIEQLQVGTLWHMGRLTVAASLSDLCGSGAEPKCLLIGVSLKSTDKVDDFYLFMEGAQHESNRWGVPIVGGDTKIGHERSFFSVGVGYARAIECLFLKRNAQPGDLIWLSGPVGGCAAGAIALARPDTLGEWATQAFAALTEPRLPIEKSRALSRLALGRGGVDISDGLAADLASMCRASKVGARIDVGSIPLPELAHGVAASLEVIPWAMGFGSGGDFQFVVTAPESTSEAMASIGFFKIGVTTKEQELLLVHEDGQVSPLPDLGHRDARQIDFVREIEFIVREVSRSATN